MRSSYIHLKVFAAGLLLSLSSESSANASSCLEIEQGLLSVEIDGFDRITTQIEAEPTRSRIERIGPLGIELTDAKVKRLGEIIFERHTAFEKLTATKIDNHFWSSAASTSFNRDMVDLISVVLVKNNIRHIVKKDNLGLWSIELLGKVDAGKQDSLANLIVGMKKIDPKLMVTYEPLRHFKQQLEAAYDFKNNTIWIDTYTLVSSKDPMAKNVLLHEVRHWFNARRMLAKATFPFYGHAFVEITRDLPPGVTPSLPGKFKEAYADFMSFDEIDTFSYQLRFGMSFRKHYTTEQWNEIKSGVAELAGAGMGLSERSVAIAEQLLFILKNEAKSGKVRFSYLSTNREVVQLVVKDIRLPGVNQGTYSVEGVALVESRGIGDANNIDLAIKQIELMKNASLKAGYEFENAVKASQ